MACSNGLALLAAGLRRHLCDAVRCWLLAVLEGNAGNRFDGYRRYRRIRPCEGVAVHAEEFLFVTSLIEDEGKLVVSAVSNLKSQFKKSHLSLQKHLFHYL